jgi:hypothetical protein
VNRSSGLKAVLLGLLSFLLGVQFAAGAAAGRAACSRKAVRGNILSAGVVLGMYFLFGLQSALITAAMAAAICAGSRLGLSGTGTAAVTAASVAIAAAAGLVTGPGLMGLTSEEIRTVLDGFSSAQLPAALMDQMVDLLAYLSPGSGAIQAVAGSAAAVAFFRSIGGTGLGKREDLRLGLLPAWIVIVGLAIALWPGPRPAFAVQASHNVLLFMSAPYFVTGAQVTSALLKTGPAMALLAAAAVLLAPPAALGAIVLTGVLDTWFDFRKRLSARTEGNPR